MRRMRCARTKTSKIPTRVRLLLSRYHSYMRPRLLTYTQRVWPQIEESKMASQPSKKMRNYSTKNLRLLIVWYVPNVLLKVCVLQKCLRSLESCMSCSHKSCINVYVVFVMYYLQHERPCCISIYKLEPKARVVYLIQHGREFCK